MGHRSRVGRAWLRGSVLLRYDDRPSERGRGGSGRAWRSTMSTEIRSKGDHSRAPWNKSCLVGQKRPLRPKEVWAIRVRLQIKRRKRDLAMFNLAIDSRGCPLGAPEGRAMSMGARMVRWVVLTVFTAITLIPLLWLLLSSFKTNAELFASPFGLPAHWSFNNFVNAWNAHPLYLYLRNSLGAAVLSAVIIIIASLMASYAPLHQFRLRRTTFGYLMFGIMLPVNALMTPILFIVTFLNLYNSVVGLSLVSTPGCSFRSAFWSSRPIWTLRRRRSSRRRDSTAPDSMQSSSASSYHSQRLAR